MERSRLPQTNIITLEQYQALFWKDERYRSLQTFGSLPIQSNQTDGAELTLFLWREFCERPDPPSIQGPSIEQAITVLRQAFGADTSI
ncbi:hypothetical protein OKW98_21640 [Pseudomonas sp. KU26590]|nr:hypothetical protein [Pseudomonas sp. KU26590]UZJ59138.1 hypothetical protein OKW98_21640 [Pseudomonas sp. KU26590]